MLALSYSMWWKILAKLIPWRDIVIALYDKIAKAYKEDKLDKSKSQADADIDAQFDDVLRQSGDNQSQGTHDPSTIREGKANSPNVH